MWIWFQDAVLLGDIDLILSNKLAVWEVWISIDTSLWPGEFLVKEVQQVDVSWGELSGVDLHVVEHASSLIHGGGESTAHVGLTITWLEAGVLPAILLWDGHQLGEGHSLLGSSGSNSWNIKSSGSKALVESFSEHDVDLLWNYLAHEFEKNWGKLLWQKWWVVVILGVDPSVQEVVVTVWKAFMGLEPLSGGFNVELGSGSFAKWQPNDIEASILSLLDPGLERSSLDSSSWPIPSVLRLDNVEFVVEPHSHGAVGANGASSPHDHWVKTVESHDEEEVSGFDEALINIHCVGSSLWDSDTHASLDELKVGSLHVWWGVRADDWQVWVVRETTDEQDKSLQDGLDLTDEVAAEHVSLDSTEGSVSLAFLGGEIKCDSVLAAGEVSIEVLDFSVAKHEGVVASHVSWLLEVQSDLVVLSIDFLVIEGNLLKAGSFVSGDWVCFVKLTNKDWEEVVETDWGRWIFTGGASVNLLLI